MVLNKVLCGLPLEAPLPKSISLYPAEQAEADHLLNAVLGHWNALKNTSPDGLRHNYLMREGQLHRRTAGWRLRVERKPQDLLLNRLPWGYSTVNFAWMPETLHIEWP